MKNPISLSVKPLSPSLPFPPFAPCLPASRKDPFIVPRPSLAATLHLTLQAQIVTHTFILEAVGGESYVYLIFFEHLSLNIILRPCVLQAPYFSWEALAIALTVGMSV